MHQLHRTMQDAEWVRMNVQQRWQTLWSWRASSVQEQSGFCAGMCAYHKAEQHAERNAVLEAMIRAGYDDDHCNVLSYIQGISHGRISPDIIPSRVVASLAICVSSHPCSAIFYCPHILSIPAYIVFRKGTTARLPA